MGGIARRAFSCGAFPCHHDLRADVIEGDDHGYDPVAGGCSAASHYERDRFAAMAEGYIDFFAPVTARCNHAAA
jgi:hypothetical protein